MKVLVAILLLTPFVFSVSGCASKKTNVLDERVNALTNEVARLDSELRQTSAALQAEQDRSRLLETQLAQTQAAAPSQEAAAPAPRSTDLYRTPSGFELSSTDIQLALKNAGYYQGEIDGKVGPSTRSAIRDFQRDNDLAVDGICGRGTWNKLKAYLDASK